MCGGKGPHKSNSTLTFYIVKSFRRNFLAVQVDYFLVVVDVALKQCVHLGLDGAALDVYHSHVVDLPRPVDTCVSL